jgi:hypothetical protein
MLPNPVGLNAEFYEFLARGELRLQRCDGCGRWRHPPRVLCAECGSEAYSWQPAAGTGRLFSWTVTHRPIDPAFEVPYVVAVVELDEGPRLVGNLTGVEPAALRLDLPVVVDVEPVTDTVGLVSFHPAG